MAAQPQAAMAPRKKLVRRAQPDHSQTLRRGVQSAFLLLNVWIGAEFYGFVRYCETSGATRRFERPAGIEGWLPIASLMNLKYLLATGHLPKVMVAGLLLLVAFLTMSFLLRKAFCSWLCPVGTVSELLWKLGHKVFGRSLVLPRWLDLPLRSLKYLLLSLFVLAVSTMSAGAIGQFLSGPYGAVADVRLLNFFRDVGGVSAASLIVLIAGSFFVQNFWCRYLCPYGALMGVVALLSPARIVRSQEACIDCAKCNKACPSLLPVDQLVTIRSAECTACLECVAVCPAEGALALMLPRRRSLEPGWIAAALGVLFFAVVLYGHWTGRWHSTSPDGITMEQVRSAREINHP